ncbi:MAG TPA: dolichyl-phosphate beta-glucosyltransferase [Candidatus Methylomirabilis sp.]|nr:dolichyl-phosphate beta-glucosyltransferase [Candidatus Methylomirabilis sp.]
MSCAYSVIIPAYDEEQTIARAVRETSKVFFRLNKPFEIIVVDDGSTDRTAAVVTTLMSSIPELILMRHGRNMGKGVAVRTGVEKAHGDIFLFLDADLATHPSDFLSFIPAFRTADIVIASRSARGTTIAERQPIFRVLAGKIFNLFAVRWYLGLPYHDTQCGFKAFTRKTKPLFRDMRTSGWAFDVELLMRARRAGYRITERPVTWRHGRDSKVRLADVWQIVRELREMKQESGKELAK